jgi:hypothetical protein
VTPGSEHLANTSCRPQRDRTVLDSNGADLTTEYFDGADHFIVFQPWLNQIGELADQWLETR